MSASDEVRFKVRAAVERVTGSPLDGLEDDEPLELDSIGRISLITELENDFDLEMDPDSIDPEVLRQVDAIPDPPPLLEFGKAVKERGQAGGHAEAAHRCATLLHLANIAIRTGRKIKYDPVREQIIGDEEANRLVNVPMRAPWHL